MSSDRIGYALRMLLCQISDPHVAREGTLAYGRVDTARMLQRCVSKILALPRPPDAVVATGDLTDSGTIEEYALLAEVLAPLPMPLYLVVGNHDDARFAHRFSRSTILAAETASSGQPDDSGGVPVLCRHGTVPGVRRCAM